MTEPLFFAATTPRHDLPLLFAGQAQKELFVNEALARLDALVHPFVESVSDTPPEAPVAGQSWLVGPAPIGIFDGYAGALASWDGTAFAFARPREGMTVRMRDGAARRCFGGTWMPVPAVAAPAGGTVVDQEARGAIATLIEALRVWGVFS